LAARLSALTRSNLLTMAKRARGLARLQSAAAVADAIEQHVKPSSAKAST